MAPKVKNLSAMQETLVSSLGWEDPLEEGMVTHSSVLAWRTPWTEEQVNGTGTSHNGVHPAGQVAWTLQKASLFKRGRDSVLQKYNSKMHDTTLTYNPNQ